MLESVPEALVLVTGLVLLSRRRQGWMAAGALVMLLVTLVVSTTIMVLWFGPIVAGDGDALMRFVRWVAPIGTIIEILGVGGMLLLVASVFTGLRRREPPAPALEGGPIDLGEVTR
ncbi:hypothetical protein Ais01nite_06650 [Asanoa ishikariensis]|nr:hypothetical protein Ais01nite_06650 [Asanoa ishikariensis]